MTGVFLLIPVHRIDISKCFGIEIEWFEKKKNMYINKSVFENVNA